MSEHRFPSMSKPLICSQALAAQVSNVCCSSRKWSNILDVIEQTPKAQSHLNAFSPEDLSIRMFPTRFPWFSTRGFVNPKYVCSGQRVCEYSIFSSRGPATPKYVQSGDLRILNVSNHKNRESYIFAHSSACEFYELLEPQDLQSLVCSKKSRPSIKIFASFSFCFYQITTTRPTR